MILISHRGNLFGKIEERENHPEYIDLALKSNYEVELDIWEKNRILYLGHDYPMYPIQLDWLLERKNKIWVHCKNISAIEYIYSTDLNYFWHDTDTMTLTSKGYIWAYPGKQPIFNSIAVLPVSNEDLSKCIGICSDNIGDYK
jgi:hypothetical protein